MRRHLLGIIALILLVGGVVGLFFGYTDNSQAGMATGIGLRVGLILGAWWMAYPQLQQLTKRFPPWLIGIMAVGGLAVVVRPRSIFIVAPLLLVLAFLQFVGWLFKPLPKKKAPRRQPPPKEDRES